MVGPSFNNVHNSFGIQKDVGQLYKNMDSVTYVVSVFFSFHFHKIKCFVDLHTVSCVYNSLYNIITH